MRNVLDQKLREFLDKSVEDVDSLTKDKSQNIGLSQ